MAKILLLDDNETILKLVSSVLTSKGHTVNKSTNLLDAIELLKREKFDLVLSDLMLPGGVNGFDFIRTIRKNPDLSHIPIIAITGERKEKKDVERAIQAGANDYIVKPVISDVLESKVAHWLQNTVKSKPVLDYSIVNAVGVWDMELKIVKLMESGMEIKSPFLLPIDAKVKIQSSFFKEIGIESPWVKVSSCKRSSSKNGYDVSVKFVELTEKETGPIKNWIRLSGKAAS